MYMKDSKYNTVRYVSKKRLLESTGVFNEFINSSKNTGIGL
jgi:hypothetical protein